MSRPSKWNPISQNQNTSKRETNTTAGTTAEMRRESTETTIKEEIDTTAKRTEIEEEEVTAKKDTEEALLSPKIGLPVRGEALLSPEIDQPGPPETLLTEVGTVIVHLPTIGRVKKEVIKDPHPEVTAGIEMRVEAEESPGVEGRTKNPEKTKENTNNAEALRRNLATGVEGQDI